MVADWFSVHWRGAGDHDTCMVAVGRFRRVTASRNLPQVAFIQVQIAHHHHVAEVAEDAA